MRDCTGYQHHPMKRISYLRGRATGRAPYLPLAVHPSTVQTDEMASLTQNGMPSCPLPPSLCSSTNVRVVYGPGFDTHLISVGHNDSDRTTPTSTHHCSNNASPTAGPRYNRKSTSPSGQGHRMIFRVYPEWIVRWHMQGLTKISNQIISSLPFITLQSELLP